MRRLARRLFTLCSAVSLLLCMAVCVLWVRARPGEDRFAGTLAGSRYTLVSNPGGLALRGPRAPPRDPQARQSVRELAAALRNDQVTWTVRANPQASSQILAFS